MKFLNTKKGKAILGIVIIAALGFGIQHYFGNTWVGTRSSASFFKDSLARQLANAAARGQTDKVAGLIKQGANPNYVGDGDVTILFWAIISKNEPGVKALLKNGADPNQTTTNGQTPLTFLSDSSLDSQTFRDMIVDLLDAGADINKPEQGGGNPLYYAVSAENLKTLNLLLEKGADTSFRKDGGLTAMYSALISERYEYVLLFVNHGFNFHPDSFGNSLQYTIQHQDASKLSGDQLRAFNQIKEKLISLGYIYPFPDSVALTRAMYDGKTNVEHMQSGDLKDQDALVYYRTKYVEFISKIDSGKLKYQDIK